MLILREGQQEIQQTQVDGLPLRLSLQQWEVRGEDCESVTVLSREFRSGLSGRCPGSGKGQRVCDQ